MKLIKYQTIAAFFVFFFASLACSQDFRGFKLTSEKIIALQQILEITGLPPVIISEQDTEITILEKFDLIAQQNWARKPGVERWEQIDTAEQEKNKTNILSALQSLGFCNEIAPTYDHYDHVLLLGALEPRVMLRLQYLEKLLYTGKLNITQIFLLGGQRSLRPEEPSSKEVGDEAAMMVNIYTKAQEQKNSPFKNIPWNSISAPMKLDLEGFPTVRPNTVDTIKEFLKQQPNPGRVLVISNQPHCYYQDTVVRGALPAASIIETVGPAKDIDTKISVALDALARALYQSKLNAS